MIAPAYVSESEIPTGYLCVDDVARLHNMSMPGAQNKMQSLRRKGVVHVVKVKMSNGKIKHFYGAK